MSILDDFEENREEKKNYCVYRLINHTKNEIYFGISNRFIGRLEDHEQDECSHTSHWDFDSDNITPEIIEKNLTKEEASEKAHEFEKSFSLSGYETIQTGGW